MSLIGVLTVYYITTILIWALSVVKKDASIIDRFWGLFFVFIAFSTLFVAKPDHWRPYVVSILVLIWGTRLSWHIHFRNRSHGEDIRYQRIRQKSSHQFWWQSLFTVFLLQANLALLVALPLFFINIGSPIAPLGWVDSLGLLVWTIGMVFEVGADRQLKFFRSEPENKGKLLTAGLWSLTRHPNYFGDACVWWGFYIFALASPQGWFSVPGPIVMTLFLRYVTGVKLLEKDLSRQKPGYAEYKKSTPAFFPRIWPRSAQQ